LKKEKKEETIEYLKKEFANLNLLKNIPKLKRKFVTILTKSEKENQMEKSLSIVFNKLLNLHRTILDMLRLYHKQDKKIIEIQYKSNITSLLLESHNKTINSYNI
jgi:hypothetical protein